MFATFKVTAENADGLVVVNRMSNDRTTAHDVARDCVSRDGYFNVKLYEFHSGTYQYAMMFWKNVK